MKSMVRRAMLAMNVTLFATAMATTTLATTALAEESQADFASSIALTIAGSAAHYRADLPAAIYAGVRHPDLRDVRVVNGAGEFVPYAITGGATQVAPNATTFNPPIFAIRGEAGMAPDQIEVDVTQRADGSVVSVRTRAPGSSKRAPAMVQPIAYIIDLTRIDSPIAAIIPGWSRPPDNFIGNARIEASDNLKDWRNVASSLPLAYLSQGGARLTQERLEFSALKTRYLRIGFSSGAPELAAIEAEAPRGRAEVRRMSVHVTGQPLEKAGEVEFDLGLRAPIDRVRVIVPEMNALAPVRLDSRPDARSEWRPVVSTVVYRMMRENQELASPALPVAPNPSQRWRVVVDQTSGGLGRKLPELEASWPAATLVFLARGSGPFTLVYGASEAKPGALPIATLVPGYRDGIESTFPVAEAGAPKTGVPTPLSALERVVGEATFGDPKKFGLWAILLLGVVVLALMAWRLAKQMR